ncbi:MAG: sigma-70 family RNA polymerase sigma factor [Myxococcales bacterium]|nr:sigma-70 family RNA polymerase sigma factor [Myxococcales bacterium]MCB9731165.1 sigma-70 family RNA polymerase sigma factor [Deltaproteobacteria bacterium]
MSEQTDALFASLYQELRRIAARRLASLSRGQTLTPSDVVNEAWGRLRTPNEAGWQSHAHFLGVAARAMRLIIVDHAREKGAQKRGGDWQRVSISLGSHGPQDVDLERVLLVHDALDALAEVSAEAADIVTLRYFAGMSVPEVAESTSLSVATVERRWRFARAWLADRLGADGTGGPALDGDG